MLWVRPWIIWVICFVYIYICASYALGCYVSLFETSYFSCFFKNHVINGSTRSGSMESTFHTSPVKHRSKGATKMSLESALSGAVNAEVYLQSNEPEAREFFKGREIWGRFLLGFCWEPTEKKNRECCDITLIFLTDIRHTGMY